MIDPNILEFLRGVCVGGIAIILAIFFSYGGTPPSTP